MNKKIYFENLDGLRFFCFLSVFFYHCFQTNNITIKSSRLYHFIKVDLFGNGNIGVNFFFVISGFLITYLLIEEKKAKGSINIVFFWLRRILRIWPLYFFCVFFGFFIFPYLKSLLGQTPNETANFFYYILFINNFDFINNGPPDSSILGVLWSIAIEEQFYLIWPIILFVFPLEKYWVVFISIICFTWLFRYHNNSYIFHEYHTFSCIGDMAVGGLGAWLIIQFKNFKNYLTTLKPIKIAAIYFLFFICFFFRSELLYSNIYIRIFERTILAVLIILIILEQCYSKNSFFKMRKFKNISSLGTISYGLYCFHFIGILITITLINKIIPEKQLWQIIIVDTLISIAITIILSKLSYHYYERPFLNIKNKFQQFI